MRAGMRKRKVETIILSDSEDDKKPSRAVLAKSDSKRQPLQLSQPLRPTSAEAARKQTPSRPPLSKSAAAARTAPSLQRCSPANSSDLVIQKRKVEQITSWLLAKQGPSLLFLSGTAGCGKTCAVTVLAAELGLPVRHWDTPTPTLWDEYLQQRAAGINAPYSSKLDEFEQFIQHAKLGMLSLHSTSSQASNTGAATSQAPAQPAAAQHILLIEDLPFCADAQQRQKLMAMLSGLAGSATRKTVVTVTKTHTQGEQDRSSASASRGVLKDIAALVEAGDAAQISLNPITKANTEMALQRIVSQGGLALGPQAVTSVADAANGDLHNALETLQLMCAGVAANPAASKAKKGSQGRKRVKADAGPTSAKAAKTDFLGKDTGLALFHALGKVLYNKRLDASSGAAPVKQATGSTAGASPQPSWSKEIPDYGAEQRVAERHQRRPMDSNPEAVLAKSDMECSTAAAFLHENMGDFLDAEAIEDAAEACHYISQSGALLDHDCVQASDWGDEAFSGQSFREAAAGSVLLRGLMYSMCHPAPRKFLSFRSPAMFTNNKAAAANLEQLRSLAWSATSLVGSSRRLASDILPYLRCMSTRQQGQHAQQLLPKMWCRVHNGAMVQQQLQPSVSLGHEPDADAALAGLSITDADIQDEIEES